VRALGDVGAGAHAGEGTDPGTLADARADEIAVGQDVGAVLVSEGLAFAYGRRTRYVAIEEEAKSEKRGAWGYGSFVRPQFWRSGARD